MSLTTLINNFNNLIGTKFVSDGWQSLRKELIAVSLDKQGMVRSGILLHVSPINKTPKAFHFYFDRKTNQYVLS